uniref:Homoserine dehydrogenase catalytic domain-containing protein n=1 Tax=Candidatus Methanogaster sp. ANME-2c ERB4 TaxID=2759911 RepID=A0A7G9YGT8_9EURY|nr:hypothetical protein FNEBEAIM_00002 [Methanosarcinales archaeon ANME-2c ERB4]QNO47222.1 hypothetical protein ADAEDOLL_00028 [Methanosarcinales archaeon ANME-2c ERB4]QNO47318.1 hypothetical protein JBNABBKG_00011 [Methanosarcinales archaeon ANME-2c ERB4]
MDGEGVSYQHARGAAQEPDIAKVDPTADVDRIDTAATITVIVNSIFGVAVGYAECVVNTARSRGVNLVDCRLRLYVPGPTGFPNPVRRYIYVG